MEIDYVIFDLHGTLEDSMDYFADLFVGITEGKGLDADRYTDFLHLAGTSLKEQYIRLFEKNSVQYTEIEIENMVNEFALLAERSKPVFYEGANEILKELRNRGITLYLSTGLKTDAAREHLKQGGLIDYFSLIMGSDDEVQKGPKHIEVFVENGLECSKAIFVGDGTRDMSLAKEFGITAVGVATTLDENMLRSAGADHVIYNLRELLSHSLWQ